MDLAVGDGLQCGIDTQLPGALRQRRVCQMPDNGSLRFAGFRSEQRLPARYGTRRLRTGVVKLARNAPR